MNNKVLFINTVYQTSSTGRIVYEIGQEILKSGGDYVAAFGRGKEVDNHCYRIGNDKDFYTHALISRITDRQGFYSKSATKKFISFIREYNPNVIHLHNLHGYYLNIPLLFEYLQNEYTGKIIWTLHDCWAFTGHCVYYTWAKCDKWKSGCHACIEKKRYPKSIICDNSKKNYRQKSELFTGLNNMTVVTPSKWLASQAKMSFLSTYPIQVINNGINLDVFKHNDNKQNATKKEKIILNVADGYDKRKGIDDIIKLSELLPENYKIVIVGMDNAIKSEKIKCIRRTRNLNELVDYYNMADYFINPTYEDNFPTVNLEALACGTPVITYNVGGSPEVVNKKCGAVVECGNEKAMVDIILHSRFLSEDCVNTAREYDKLIKYKEYLELY